jgi:hypothetical protein
MIGPQLVAWLLALGLVWCAATHQPAPGRGEGAYAAAYLLR